MRALLIVGVIGLASWYVFFRMGEIDEQDVRTLYEEYWDAFMAGNGTAVCGMFHEDFSGTMLARTPAGDRKETATRQTACEGTDEFFATKKAMEEKAGTELHLNVEYTIDDIRIDPDGESATATMTSEVRVGTQKRLFLKIAGEQSDRIVRSGGGGVQFVSSDAAVSF